MKFLYVFFFTSYFFSNKLNYCQGRLLIPIPFDFIVYLLSLHHLFYKQGKKYVLVAILLAANCYILNWYLARTDYNTDWVTAL